jgi:predicted nucleotidyltransferase component of viral defense system
MSAPKLRDYHLDSGLFRESLMFTQVQTGFSARLIEKDYYASLALEYLLSLKSSPLVFKGGTCLGKVHNGFYRLSEDLDFGISVPVDLARSERSRKVAATKAQLTRISQQLPCFRIIESLRGHNNSTQYTGCLAYRSLITGAEDLIKLEISVREPISEAVACLPAQTLLVDSLRRTKVLEAIVVPSLSCREAYAEKLRAALTRRDPAIRDFFDIDYGLRSEKITPTDPLLLSLVQKKLAIAGNDPIDVTERKRLALIAQIQTQLKPVLRKSDLMAFELDRVFDIIRRITAPWIGSPPC